MYYRLTLSQSSNDYRSFLIVRYIISGVGGPCLIAAEHYKLSQDDKELR